MAKAKGTEILHASGSARSDTAGQGIVGSKGDTNSERNKPAIGGGSGANEAGAGGQETLNYGGGYFVTETAGLVDGVNKREALSIDDAEPEYDYTVDSFTGNAPERKVGRVNNQNVSGKGKKFTIGEF